MTRMTRITTTLVAAAILTGIAAAQEETERFRVEDAASGLTVSFPREVGEIKKHDVSMSVKTDGRDRFPRFAALTPGGVRLEASLVPYPPGSAATNPQARLGELAAAMAATVGGRWMRREFTWADGFPALDVLCRATAPEGVFRARLVLYPRDVALLQTSGTGVEAVAAPRFDAFFASLRRKGVRPPPSFLHRTALYSFRYAPGTRLSKLDGGILVETDDGVVYVRPENVADEDPLAAVARLLGERVAREGPLEVRAGPRMTGTGARRCAAMTVAAKSGGEPTAERIVRYYPHSAGRLLVTATRSSPQDAGSATGVGLVISSFEVVQTDADADSAGDHDDD